MYDICAPDGSCGIQLALLYWLLPESDWVPTFHDAGLHTAYLKFKRREPGSRQPQILEALRSLITERTRIGSNARHILELWHNGLSSNKLCPIQHSDQYLELLEVCALLREGSNSSIFIALDQAPISSSLGRVPSTLYFDARFPARSQSFLENTQILIPTFSPPRSTLLPLREFARVLLLV